MSIPSLLILPGDGIGPEVMAEVRKVISWLSTERSISFEVSEDLVGGAAYDTHGVPSVSYTHLTLPTICSV